MEGMEAAIDLSAVFVNIAVSLQKIAFFLVFLVVIEGAKLITSIVRRG